VGLSYCKGLSKKAVSSIISERRKRPFSSVADIYRRTLVERDALENLIRAGFLDALSDRKADRLRLLEEAKRLPEKRRDDRQPEIPLEHPSSWWESREDQTTGYLPLAETQKEQMEWETLGLNVSRHPLLPYRTALEDLGVTPSEEVKELPHGSRVRAAGLFECLQCPPTKSGRPVWFLLIEDEHGLLQATIFRTAYERFGYLLHHRGTFLLEGRVEQDRRKGFSFVVERVGDLREALTEVPRALPGSGAFPWAKRRGRRAG
jgi:error-prone DNA polymerase